MDRIDFNFDLGPLFGVIMLFALAALGFIIWMIIDALGRPEEDFSSASAKTGWTVGLILGLFFGFGFLGLIVAIVYFVTVRLPARRRTRAAVFAAPHAPGPPTPPGAPPLPRAGARPAPLHCSNCGVKVVAGAYYCHSCGTRLT